MKDDKTSSTLYSEEVSDIVERMPTRWSLWVSMVFSFMIVVAITLGFLIEYPDTVSGSVSVTGEVSPVRMTVPCTGRLHLVVNNTQTVKRGQILAYVESGADFGDVLALDSLCKKAIMNGIIPELADETSLGELNSVYANLFLAAMKYNKLKGSKLYVNMRQTLNEEEQAARQMVENVDKEIALRQAFTEHQKQELRNDSLLLAQGAVSENEVNDRAQSVRTSQIQLYELQNTSYAKMSEVSKNHVEKSRIDINEEEALREAYDNVTACLGVLVAQIGEWKKKYLVVSPIDGRVEYLGFWKNYMYAAEGQDFVSIVPVQGNVCAEMYVPLVGAGKIEAGQDVNIKLYDYPYQEFGSIKGKVKSISLQSAVSRQGNNTAETYLVRVDFPDGLRTNYGKVLQCNFETKGTADIIVRKQRLIQRLFDNLRNDTGK